MKLRVARHTNDIKPMLDFYTRVIGLWVLGSFKYHDGYDGVFIGSKEENWELEFTTSPIPPDHKPDHDDLLVLYAGSQVHYHEWVRDIVSKGYIPQKPANPYWIEKGTLFLDPDGYGVMITWE